MTATTKATMKAKRCRQPEKTAENDPWFAHNNSSHIPNAETAKAIEDSVAGMDEEISRDDLRKLILGGNL